MIVFQLQLKVCPKHYCLSTVGVREDLFKRDPKTVPVTDFFGSLRPVELTSNTVDMSNLIKNNSTEKRRTPLDIERQHKLVKPFPNLSQMS